MQFEQVVAMLNKRVPIIHDETGCTGGSIRLALTLGLTPSIKYLKCLNYGQIIRSHTQAIRLNEPHHGRVVIVVAAAAATVLLADARKHW